MNAPSKPEKPVKQVAKPSAEPFDAAKMHERTMRRFPKVMARLGE